MNSKLKFFRLFPRGIDLDSPRDMVQLEQICESCKWGIREWRATRKHKAQTFKRCG